MNIWLIDVLTSTFMKCQILEICTHLKLKLGIDVILPYFFFVLAVQIIQITNQRNVVFHAHKYIYGKLLSLFCHMIWMS